MLTKPPICYNLCRTNASIYAYLPCLNARLAKCLNRFLIAKVLLGAFNNSGHSEILRRPGQEVRRHSTARFRNCSSAAPLQRLCTVSRARPGGRTAEHACSCSQCVTNTAETAHICRYHCRTRLQLQCGVSPTLQKLHCCRICRAGSPRPAEARRYARYAHRLSQISCVSKY